MKEIRTESLIIRVAESKKEKEQQKKDSKSDLKIEVDGETYYLDKSFQKMIGKNGQVEFALKYANSVLLYYNPLRYDKKEVEEVLQNVIIRNKIKVNEIRDVEEIIRTFVADKGLQKMAFEKDKEKDNERK